MKNSKFSYNGKAFSSAKALAKCLSLNPKSVKRLINESLSEYQVCRQGNQNINKDMSFPSARALAEFLNISPQTLGDQIIKDGNNEEGGDKNEKL